MLDLRFRDAGRLIVPDWPDRPTHMPGKQLRRAHGSLFACLPGRCLRSAKGRSGNRSFFRASGARFTLKAARINANPRGDMIPRGLVPCVAVPNGV